MQQLGTEYPPSAALLENLSRQSYPVSTLYVIATPIGNMADISVRALHLLSLVDAVACEDTRNTAHLLALYGLKKRLIAIHQHNERERAALVIEQLRSGERIAFVSDAGTPAISDPGARLVDAVRAANLRVMPLPGPCAAITALSASGLLNNEFHFVGFLPAKSTQRNTALKLLGASTATLVFYEAPHRISDTLTSMAQQFGPERRIVIARELTKLFEEIHRCTLGEATLWLAAEPKRNRGEFVLIIEGASSNVDTELSEADRVLNILLSECSVSQAAALASKMTGIKKNKLYERALSIKNVSTPER